jgi:hypothetical protein
MRLFMRAILAALLFASLIDIAPARDNGQWADQPPEIRRWFQGLSNQQGGQCCSFADGVSIEDPDWRITPTGTYQVFYREQWRDVPATALIKGANRIGHAVLWPIDSVSGGGVVIIRCFMPGSET